MGFTEIIEELRQAGLLETASDPHLTVKGRGWLRALEDVETQEVVDSGESQADLVMSTNGIFR